MADIRMWRCNIRQVEVPKPQNKSNMESNTSSYKPRLTHHFWIRNNIFGGNQYWKTALKQLPSCNGKMHPNNIPILFKWKTMNIYIYIYIYLLRSKIPVVPPCSTHHLPRSKSLAPWAACQTSNQLGFRTCYGHDKQKRRTQCSITCRIGLSMKIFTVYNRILNKYWPGLNPLPYPKQT